MIQKLLLLNPFNCVTCDLDAVQQLENNNGKISVSKLQNYFGTIHIYK